MKRQNQKVKKHRWARKVFFSHSKTPTRRLRSRKKSFETYRVKVSACDNTGYGVRYKSSEKFNLMATILTVAPMYPDDRAKVIKFFEDVSSFLKSQEQCSFKKTVVISCQNVENVDPSGCAFLFSYIEMFQELYPKVRFMVKYPNTIKRHYGVNTNQPNHVFNHLELYKKLDGQKAPTCHTLPPPNLRIWKTTSFSNTDSSLVGQILEGACKKVPSISKTQKAKIYKILIEAVNNCPEHAYDPSFMKNKGLQYNKTRCLFAIIEHRLVVVVADLGVGVRHTLENGGASFFWRLFQRFRRIKGEKTFASKDSDCLQGMINIKDIRERSTRYHKFSNRGYGGVDLQNAIKELKGKLLIMSGTGSLMLDASTPEDFEVTPKDFCIGLNGTLISMSIPLTV